MILVIGEILCDLICVNKNKNMFFGAYVGGAPFNVAYNLSSLGVTTSFFGNVGDDLFGKYILNEISYKENLDVKINIRNDSDTTLAIYNVLENKKRDFSFIRKNTADFKYDLKSLKEIDLNDYKIIHFGSLFLSKKNSCSVMEEYIQYCKSKNKILSFDFNYRNKIFKSLAEAKKAYSRFLKYFDIIKFNKKELYMYTHEKDIEKALRSFRSNQLIFVTLGKKGCISFINGKIYNSSTFRINKIDDVGAGDSFLSGILFYLTKFEKLNAISETTIYDMLKFANACGTMTSRVHGALDGYHSFEEVIKYINENN